MKRACIVCLAPFETPGSRCPEHRKRAWEGAERRPTHHTAAWAKLRGRVLKRDGWRCQIGGPTCATSATEVDHIVPLGEASEAGWTDEEVNAPSNLRAVCGPCHASKSGREGHAARERRRREGGRSELHRDGSKSASRAIREKNPAPGPPEPGERASEGRRKPGMAP